MPTRIARKQHLIAAALLAFYFLPLLVISRYDYPSGDDYRTLVRARQLGATGAAAAWYANWSGRYSSFFVQSFIAARDSWLAVYRLVPAALLVAGFACLYYFVRTLFGAGLSRRAAFTLAAIVYALLVAVTPDPATGFYWLSTNVQYAGAFFASLLTLALFVKLERAAKTPTKAAIYLMLFVLIGFVAGLNELSIIFLASVFASVIIFHFARFRKLHAPGLALLLVCVAFAAATFFAPGNFVRIRETKTEFHPAEIASGSVGLTIYLLVELLSASPLVPASVLYLSFLHANRERLAAPLALLAGVRWWWVLAALACAVTLANAALFAAVGVGANSLPFRVKNVYVYSIALGWLFLLTALFVDLARRGVEFRLPAWAARALAAFVALFLLTGFELKLGGASIPGAGRLQQAFSAISTGSVSTNAYLDLLTGRAGRYRAQSEERERLLREATGDAVEFPLYSYAPKTIFVQDANHPYAAPEVMSQAVAGSVKQLRFVPTGPAMTQKEGF
ncbi:MAG TPA: DUF6056 family protein [Pyrinomonadaceae bacterium]|jgi:hypothetical protein|nr:DUF6056 family protein [Pyrinomonadaceae bacterium]